MTFNPGGKQVSPGDPPRFPRRRVPRDPSASKGRTGLSVVDRPASSGRQLFIACSVLSIHQKRRASWVGQAPSPVTVAATNLPPGIL